MDRQELERQKLAEVRNLSHHILRWTHKTVGSSDDDWIPDDEYQRGFKRSKLAKGWQEGKDDEDKYWSDLVISDNSYLTDEHRFVADAGSFQFCKDLNGELVDLDSIHTAQSTLNDLLRNREIF